MVPEETPRQKMLKALEMIAEDQANDAREFDGKPFNGRTVAEYFGNHGAAIAALANIIKEMLNSETNIRVPEWGEGCDAHMDDPYCPGH